jgi:hypothetical protein
MYEKKYRITFCKPRKAEAFTDENNNQIVLQIIDKGFGRSHNLTIEEAEFLIKSIQLGLENLKNG